MEIRSPVMPCKIRKQRRLFPTSSSANNSLSSLQLLMDHDKAGDHSDGKCVDDHRRTAKEEEEEELALTLQKPETDNLEGAVTKNVERSRNRNKSRSSPGRVYIPEVLNNPHYRQSSNFMKKDNSVVGMTLNYVAKPFEGKSQPCGEIETVTKAHGHGHPIPTHGLDEIKHSLMVSKDLLKLLTHMWTSDSNHDHHHRTSISLASTLNHELNKARSHVNKLIQRSNNTSGQQSEEQDKIRVAVKTISQELETERKLRRQSERMNKKLGQELADTRSCLAKAMKKAETEKQATEILEQLCEKMVRSIEEDRIEFEQLKRESERVRREMEEEREMLRVADMLREERVQMKLIDAKHEYEDKHKQMNILVRDLEELLEADNDIDQITPKVLSWYQSKSFNNKEITHSIWYENEKRKVVNDENALDEETKGLSWFENNVEAVNVNDQRKNTQNEVMGRNSDCIEWEFGLDMQNESKDLNECPEEKDLVLVASMKEYEDEMERYKMIKDLRDRIVSGGSELSRDTLEFGSYI